MTKVSQLPYERVARDTVLTAIDKCIGKVQKAADGRELAAVRDEYLRTVFHCQTMSSLAFVRFTLNTRDEFYGKEKDYYDEISPELSAKSVEFKKAFLGNKHIDEAREFINPLIFEQYALDIKCTDERAIPYRVEENKIVTEYTKLMAETLYEFDGEKLPLASLRKYFVSPDRETRKRAYTALGNTLASIGDKLDDIFDRLVKVRTATAKALGYENFVELGDNLMGRISYDRNDIRSFREGVLGELVPAVASLKGKLRKSLGIDKFMFYDDSTYFACGNPTPVIDAQKMFEEGKKMYRDMGSEPGEFFDMMIETDAFDVFPREGKWGGGYMDSFSDFRQPFILANFNGTSDDVDVLTHEAGHAFAAYCSFKRGHDQDLALGMETAETHSMSMEFLCGKYMKAFFGKRADDYNFAHLLDAISFIPYGTIVDYFQEIVYSRPELTPAQRNEVWLDLEKQFRPYLSFEGIPYLEKGTRWQYQMHIFENPFYYIDYCLAQTAALQFYFMSLEDHDKALDAYLNFVHDGATKSYPELLANAGLSSPFEKGTISDIAKKANKIL